MLSPAVGWPERRRTSEPLTTNVFPMHLSGETPTTPLRRGFGPWRTSAEVPARSRSAGENFLTKDMSYWTSEIAGKVKEILIINPQQCGPEPQIFAVGKRRKRARAGERACFAPGRGRMRLFCMRRKCSRSAAPGGGRFGALIGVVSAGISGGVLIRVGAGTPGGSGRDGARADVARWPRKAESRKEPGAASGRELSARGRPALSGRNAGLPK